MISSLKWESDFFSKRIGSVAYKELPDMRQLGGFYDSANDYDVVVMHIPIEELTPKIYFILSKMGFFLADTKVDFKFDIKTKITDKEHNIRVAKIDDYDRLATFTKDLFKDSRYFYLPFSKEEGNKFFAEWLRNAILGKFDDKCFFQEECHIEGFVTTRLNNVEKNIRIGLIGVNQLLHGKGIGKKLLNYTFSYGWENGAESLYVATQAKNMNAVGFYTHLGGEVSEITQVFYYLPNPLERYRR